MKLTEQIKQIKRLLGEQGTPIENDIIDELRTVLDNWGKEPYTSMQPTDRYKQYHTDIQNLIHTILNQPA
jgi:hypothetical protein